MSNIQKRIAVGVMAIAMLFGTMSFVPRAYAQEADPANSDIVALINQLLQQVRDLQKQLGDLKASQNVETVEKFNFAKIKQVTVRNFDPTDESGDEYDQYRVVLNDGTVYLVKRTADLTDEQFALAVRQTGYSGTIEKFTESVKRLSGVTGEKYYVKNIENLTAQDQYSYEKNRIMRAYTIDLGDDTQFQVWGNKDGSTNKGLENQLRATGFAGSMKNFLDRVEELDKSYFLMKDVKSVTSQNYEPAEGEAFTRFVIRLKDAEQTKFVVDRTASMTNEEFVTELRNTGFGGKISNFNKEVKKLAAVYGSSYRIKDIETVSTKQLRKKGGTLYSITLIDGTEHEVFRAAGDNETRFEKSLRVTGFSGVMKNFTKALKDSTWSTTDSEEINGDTPAEGSENTEEDGDTPAEGSENTEEGNSTPAEGSENTEEDGDTPIEEEQTQITKFGSKAIDKVNRRDFYSDKDQKNLSYRLYTITLKDGTKLKLQREAGTSNSKFTKQLSEIGYKGTLKNFQKKINVLKPRVLGASISLDPMSQLGLAIDAFEVAVRAYLK